MTAWCCEFARDDGFAGFVRLDDRAEDGPGAHWWFWAYLVGVPGVPGIVAVRDHEVPAARQGLEIRAEGLWAELWCETPGEHWTFGLEAFGVRLDAPEDALRPGGEIGDRIAVGLDLEWDAPDLVHGDVLVADGPAGDERFTIEAWGRFSDGDPLGAGADRGEPDGGEPDQGRVLVPVPGGVCEWALVRTSAGLRWNRRLLTG